MRLKGRLSALQSAALTCARRASLLEEALMPLSSSLWESAEPLKSGARGAAAASAAAAAAALLLLPPPAASATAAGPALPLSLGLLLTLSSRASGLPLLLRLLLALLGGAAGTALMSAQLR
jgi:hypothetical protein